MVATPPQILQADTSARTAWWAAVADIAAKAKAALPQCKGRIEQAVTMVLAGDVELLPDGTAKVTSQSSGTRRYVIVNGTCECRDFPKAPQGMCKHRIATRIARRAQTLATAQLQQQLDPPAPEALPTSQALPEPPAAPPSPSIPAQFLVELHGKMVVTYGGLLAMAFAHGLVKLAAHFISVNASLALAEATAEFADGRVFQECADATPENVNSTIRPHFPRLALTRAKSRALRDALNISVAALEELEG